MALRAQKEWDMGNEEIEILSPLLSRREAAQYLSDRGLETAPQTLARKFHEGTGPLCTHVGDRAMYRKAHLDEYFVSQVSAPRRSSSEPRKPMATQRAFDDAADRA
jgi:hypothetical protein